MPADHEQRVQRSPISRAVALLVRPTSEWELIAQELGGLKEAFIPYALVWGLGCNLVGALLSCILWGAFGWIQSLMSGGMPTAPNISAGVLWGLAFFAQSCVVQLVLAKILDVVGPSFGYRRSWVMWTRVLVYASTPKFLLALVAWIPVLGFVFLAITYLWSFSLAIQGSRILLKSPRPQLQPVAPEIPTPTTAEVLP